MKLTYSGDSNYSEGWNDLNPSFVGQGDRTLTVFLKSLDNSMKKFIIYDFCPEDGSGLDKFPLIFKNINSDSLRPIFSRETANEFHKLTIAAFEGFATTFIQIKKTANEMVSIDY